MSRQAALKQVFKNAFAQLGDMVATITITSRVKTFDPLTSETNVVETTSTGEGIIDRTTISYIDDTTQTGKHYKMYLQSEVEPKHDDTITVGTDVYSILFINEYNSNNLTLAYEVGLKL